MNDLMKRIKKDEENLVMKIYVKENGKENNLVLRFQNGSEQYAELTNEEYEYRLTKKSIEILKYIVSKRQGDVVSCARGYYKSGRDYLIFLYDLVTLCWLLEKLPDDFHKLKDVNKDERELLHNRLVSQLAFKYKQRNDNVEFEKKNLGHKPDLCINNIFVEIKSILSAVIATKDKGIELSYKDFYSDFERQYKKAIGQTSNQGMIVMGFWSKRINNELREYFIDSLSKEPIVIEKDKTIIVLEGDKPLEDYYVVIPSKFVLEKIGNYCNGGYQNVDPMTYMKTMMRKGFPLNKSTSDLSDMSVIFRMG